MSRAFNEVALFCLLSYQAILIMPPETAMLGKKCWVDTQQVLVSVTKSLTIMLAVQVDPPSIDFVNNTLEFPSPQSSRTRYTAFESDAIWGIVKSRKLPPGKVEDRPRKQAFVTTLTFWAKTVPPFVTFDT